MINERKLRLLIREEIEYDQFEKELKKEFLKYANQNMKEYKKKLDKIGELLKKNNILSKYNPEIKNSGFYVIAKINRELDEKTRKEFLLKSKEDKNIKKKFNLLINFLNNFSYFEIYIFQPEKLYDYIIKGDQKYIYGFTYSFIDYDTKNKFHTKTLRKYITKLEDFKNMHKIFNDIDKAYENVIKALKENEFIK